LSLNSRSKGFFIEPTVIHTTDPQVSLCPPEVTFLCPQDVLLNTELFGPVLTVLEYPDESVSLFL
jgi:acyl-CoA reductase-like NAD-dependent aldehyde dehydrogenase